MVGSPRSGRRKLAPDQDRIRSEVAARRVDLLGVHILGGPQAPAGGVGVSGGGVDGHHWAAGLRLRLPARSSRRLTSSLRHDRPRRRNRRRIGDGIHVFVHLAEFLQHPDQAESHEALPVSLREAGRPSGPWRSRNRSLRGLLGHRRRSLRSRRSRRRCRGRRSLGLARRRGGGHGGVRR